ncbi:MAG: lipopolysaccharide heptosyltransferase II [Candidatus Omnitrophica bacterium]|nr:lipopolysaccharide heptosyltransferase II [Candidatus Omnitrophota bacterium]
MKVLQILPELNMGGVERGCVDLAKELVQRNHQALVVSNGGNLVKDLREAQVKHFQLPVHKKSLFSILQNVPKVAKIIDDEKVDVVHARSRVPAIIGFLAARSRGTAFITTCHGYYNTHLFSRVMGWGKAIIVSSKVIAEHMQKDFAVPGKRISFIPRGVDLEEFRFFKHAVPEKPKSEVFTIGIVSRLTPIKGHVYLLKSLPKIIRELPKVKVLIAGGPSPGKEKYREELKILIRRLSIGPYVDFVGEVRDVPKFLSSIDLLVLPTITQEAFGRVLIEAGACGVPVIASKVGGIVDIVEDGVDGILVPPADHGELAKAIIKLYREPQTRKKFALAAREKVERNFSLGRMAEKTIHVYEKALADLRILVIKLSALGDLILIGPTLKALRNRFPKATITVLAGKAYASILRDCPYVDEILEFAPKKNNYIDVWRFSANLRKQYYDIVIDLQNSRKSHLLAYLSGCASRYGYDNGKLSFLLNKKIKDTKTAISPIEHQARTMQLLNIESVEEKLELWINRDDQAWAEDFLTKNNRDPGKHLVGINLGASANRPGKKWEKDNLFEFLTRLSTAKIQILLTGDKMDKGLAQELKAAANIDIIDAVNETSILQLASLIKHCDVYITCDSAPLHIAYAVKTPVVALFGPTDPKKHALKNQKQRLIYKELECSPCYKRRCQKHLCMKGISAEDVLKAVNQLLDGKNKKGQRHVKKIKSRA